MPQPSYPYACARISALENGLLDAAAIKRMADGSLDDALRTLLDMRYGGIPDATSADCERMIENERVRTAREIREISPAPEITDLFLLPVDVHNLKVLLKARLLGSADADVMEGGLYALELLQGAVQSQDYRVLPPAFCETLNELERALKVRVEPQRISVALDRAYLTHALGVARASKDPFVTEYFETLADFDNMITFLRLRAMGAPQEDMRDMLLPEGTIRAEALIGAYELSHDALVRILTDCRARGAIAAGLNEMAKSGSIGAMEKMRDDTLLSLVKSHRHDVLTLFPVVGYLFAREREAKAVRLILTVKRNGLNESVIAERLREMYG